jgi:1,4-dihydroxy-2-naphthoyl-CoA hydrolase
MPFVYPRTIHFPDTDAAGVVYFPNYLSICHEAYEESLAAAGIPIRTFFSAHKIVIPVSKSSADYLRPLFCGDKIGVSLKATLLTPDTYAIDFDMTRLEPKPSKPVAHVRTSHVCIRADTRERTPLPPELAAWIDSTNA